MWLFTSGFVSTAVQRNHMKTTKLLLATLALVAVGAISGCKWLAANIPSSTTATPTIADNIRKSLDEAGLKEVTISNNPDKGIVTLGGQVTSDAQKTQAETITKSFAGAEVVADQIAVIPVGQGQELRAVNSDLDQGIAHNLDAALLLGNMHDDVKYDVKNGVVTLNGDVDSEFERSGAEKTATGIPNVKQVVNAIQVVKNRKASSSN
jgi:osmotically-inducible protein OsmY